MSQGKEPPISVATAPGTCASETKAVDGVSFCAILYLALPNLIFLYGWLKFPVALAMNLLLLVFVSGLTPLRSVDWSAGYTRSAFTQILIFAAIWAAFGGGSHFVFANPDWVIRDAVLGDLVNKAWPVNYRSPEGAPALLRSAIGYFLPLALFGKAFGSAFMDIAVFAWTTVGVALFLLLLPLQRRAGAALLIGITVAVFFSGMDFVGQVISTQALPMFPLRLEWWGPLSYPSLSVQLLWAPNHCLPIWIGTLLVLRYWNEAPFLMIIVAVIPLSLIWTPFAALGLVPFALLGSLRYLNRFDVRSVPWISFGAAAIFSLPICLFLLLDVGHIDAGVANQGAGAAQRVAPSLTLNQYLTFVSFEFLLLALVLAPLIRQRRDVFGLAFMVLMLLPLVGYGPSNDLLLRLSTPPLVVLLVICLQTLFIDSRPSIKSTRWMAWMFLAIGAHSGFNELWRAATYHGWQADYSHSLTDRTGGHLPAHYVGQFDDSALLGSLLRHLPEASQSRTERIAK